MVSSFQALCVLNRLDAAFQERWFVEMQWQNQSHVQQGRSMKGEAGGIPREKCIGIRRSA